jgi:hypothetical protein
VGNQQRAGDGPQINGPHVQQNQQEDRQGGRRPGGARNGHPQARGLGPKYGRRPQREGRGRLRRTTGHHRRSRRKGRGGTRNQKDFKAAINNTGTEHTDEIESLKKAIEEMRNGGETGLIQHTQTGARPSQPTGNNTFQTRLRVGGWSPFGSAAGTRISSTEATELPTRSPRTSRRSRKTRRGGSGHG